MTLMVSVLIGCSFVSADVAQLADTSYSHPENPDAHSLFRDNCAQCHGENGQGQAGIPNLTDNDWLWGDAPEEIADTIRAGINSGHQDQKISEMIGFGDRGMLSLKEQRQVVTYVFYLAGRAENAFESELLGGSRVYDSICAFCHGSNGEGSQVVGAPKLSDATWLHGGDIASVSQIVKSGHIGVMPAWEGILTEPEIHMLAEYVKGFSEGN